MGRKVSKHDEFPLAEYTDGLMAKLREQVPAALDLFDADAIHNARVATRRMKAALELMDPVLSKRHRKPLADGLKRLRRRLGPLRDADVMLEHLTAFEKDRKHAPAAEWLHNRLQINRRKLLKESQKGASVAKELQRTETWPMVRQEISEAREAVDTLLAESLHVQTDAFAEQAERLVRDFGGALPSHAPAARAGMPLWDGQSDGSPAADGEPTEVTEATTTEASRQNPHDLRITGKALRYTLEMAAEEGHAIGGSLLRTFKRMQESLGSWHDLVVLADTALTEVVSQELNHHDAAMADHLLELAKYAVKRSRQDLMAFCKLWSQQGNRVTAKIRASFPLTRAVTADFTETAAMATVEKTSESPDAEEPAIPTSTESERDRDPDDSTESEVEEAEPKEASPVA